MYRRMLKFQKLMAFKLYTTFKLSGKMFTHVLSQYMLAFKIYTKFKFIWKFGNFEFSLTFSNNTQISNLESRSKNARNGNLCPYHSSGSKVVNGRTLKPPMLNS